MNILLQVQEYKEIETGKIRWNLLRGIKMVLKNFKKFFTEELQLTSGNCWKETTGQVNITTIDRSLIINNEGEPEWIRTPENNNQVALFISHKIN